MTTCAVIVARMGSTRLPGKNLMDVEGEPMMARLVERVRHSSYVDQIVIATTDFVEDDALEALSRDLGIGCYRGSSEDVLARVAEAGESVAAEVIVQILGDNPLVHSELIDDTVRRFLDGELDYAASVTTEYPSVDANTGKFPIGIRVQVLPPNTLRRADKLATGKRYREDATQFIFDNPNVFRLGFVEASDKWAPLNAPTLHFAVNYQKNLELVREIFRELYPADRNFSLEDVMDLVIRRRELLSMMGG
jgi:spore coat polysaccharide biosynthesis protein SpsF